MHFYKIDIISFNSEKFFSGSGIDLNIISFLLIGWINFSVYAHNASCFPLLPYFWSPYILWFLEASCTLIWWCLPVSNFTFITDKFVLELYFKTSYSNTKTQYKEKYVYSGDTLWSIAYKESSSNDYYRGKDIRFIIKDLKDINHLEDANLNDGQKLLIPEI